MKWLLFATLFGSVVLLAACVLGIVFLDELKQTIDRYANLAGVLGFFVSVIGFILTVSAVFETLRVSERARQEIEKATVEGREETRALIERIRTKFTEDLCDQAYLLTTEARNAIRNGAWLRAVEKCQEARQTGSRLIAFQGLLDHERAAVARNIEDLRTTVNFIERNRLKKAAPAGLPADKLQPVDALLDELERIRSRLQQQVLELP